MNGKEFLKKGVIYLSNSQKIGVFIERNNETNFFHVCKVGNFIELSSLFPTHPEDAAMLQDSIGEFIQDAINEKLNHTL